MFSAIVSRRLAATAQGSILSATVFHLPAHAGGRQKLSRAIGVQLRDPGSRCKIVGLSNEFAGLDGVERLVGHRPALIGALGNGLFRNQRYLRVPLVANNGV